MKITVGEKIGEGNYRICYAVTGTDLCIKKKKKYIAKKTFGHKLHYRSKIYNFFRFGGDLNRIEYKAIMSLPEELQPYMPSHVQLLKEDLIMQRAKNADGSYSKMMQKGGKVRNKVFWEHIDKIVMIFSEKNIFPSDIFRNGNNIVIKKISENEWIPVIIDFKRMNQNLDLFQYFEFGNKKKFYRRLNRFIKKFKPDF